MKLISSFLLVLGVAVVFSAALYVDSAQACGGAPTQAEAYDGGACSASSATADAGCGDCESKAGVKTAMAAADGGSCECPIHTSGKSGHYKVGDKVAFDVSLADCCGKEVDLRQTQRDSKAIVLAFYSASCPVVKAYNERIVKLAKEYKDRGVTFLAVNSNVNETAAQVHEYKSKHSLSFTNLIDKDSRLANAFQAEVTPHIYVIDKDGVLRYRGPVDDSQDPANVKHEYLRTALDAVLKGSNVRQAEVDAFGCAIRRL